MTKSLMISIRPEHAENILNGKKTLDLRTWIPKGYVGWVYVYVCKTIRNYKMSYYYQPKNQENIYRLHGNIPFRFWFDEYEEYNDYSGCTNNENGYECENEYMYHLCELPKKIKELCLTCDEIETYGNGKTLYAWHIKQLEVFDTPKRLSEFYVTNKGLTYKYIKEYEEYTNDTISFRLKKAPQKMQWVYAKELENE